MKVLWKQGSVSIGAIYKKQKMKEEYIKLKLPMPISVNIAYAWKVKRFKSPDYKKWIKLAKLELNKQIEYRISWDNWLEVIYIYNFSLYTKKKAKRVKDVANYEKVLSDFLADNIEWFEDHKIKKVTLEKIDNKEQFVNILIKEYDKS